MPLAIFVSLSGQSPLNQLVVVVCAADAPVAWPAAPVALVAGLLRWAGTRSLVFWTPYFHGSTICMTVLAACALPAPIVGPSVRK
jgi:hypothetical protein